MEGDNKGSETGDPQNTEKQALEGSKENGNAAVDAELDELLDSLYFIAHTFESFREIFIFQFLQAPAL